jgi:hypothetical protein
MAREHDIVESQRAIQKAIEALGFDLNTVKSISMDTSTIEVIWLPSRETGKVVAEEERITRFLLGTAQGLVSGRIRRRAEVLPVIAEGDSDVRSE